MGTVYSAVKTQYQNVVVNLGSARQGKKRKHGDYTDSETPSSTSKRCRMESTMKLVYQSLFVEGKGSDVTVSVLGKDWYLHKIYLRQSPYFESMFSGKWSETDKSDIKIEVIDPNINIDCLNVVFGSFYCYELNIDPSIVVPVLAASTLLQMEGLIEQCCEIMLENISPTTVLQYYSAARDYGLKKVVEEVVYWLAVNLVTYFYEHYESLAEIQPELMLKIVSHKDLCVIQTEMFLYLLLRMWIYVRCNPSWDLANSSEDVENYFRNRSEDTSKSFLESDEGKEYREVFDYLRFEHLLDHISDISTLTRDKVLPDEWLLKAYKTNWVNFLRFVTTDETGAEEISEEDFYKKSFRLGKMVVSSEGDTWKWNCFCFGIELVWSMEKSSICVQRVKGPLEPDNSALSRKIFLMVSIVSLNDLRQVVKKVSSKIHGLRLRENEEAKLLEVNSLLVYPLYLQANVLVSPCTFDDDLSQCGV